MKDKRNEKIKELKENIKKAQAELIGHLKDYRETEKNPEATDEEKKEKRKEVSTFQAVLQGLAEELQKTKLNKTGSKFFEWIPSAPNRRMRKQAAKMMRV